MEFRRNNNQLENSFQYNDRWRSIRKIYLTIFLRYLCFTILTGGYGSQFDRFVGNSNSHWLLMAIVCSPTIWNFIIGYWSNKLGSIRWPMQVSLVVFILPCILYYSLDEDGTATFVPFLLFLGVYYSSITLCHSYLGASTTINERTHAFCMAYFAQLLGETLGYSGFKIASNYFKFDVYPNSMWLYLVSTLMAMIIFLPAIFKEHKIAAKEAMVIQGYSSEKEACQAIKPHYLFAWIFIAASFIVVTNFISILGISIDLILNGEVSQLYFYFVMITAVVTVLFIGPLSKRFGERNLLIWGGFPLIMIGQLLYVRGEFCNRFYISHIVMFAALSVGFPIAMTLIRPVFSKNLGPRPQGLWMGFISNADFFGYIAGNFLQLHQRDEPDMYSILAYTSGTIIIITTIFIFCRQLFVQPKIENQPHAAEELQRL